MDFIYNNIFSIRIFQKFNFILYFNKLFVKEIFLVTFYTLII